MKTINLIFFFFICFLCEAQTNSPKEQLYYFKTKDSLVGVRNASGKIILKPRKVYWDYDDNYKKNRVEGDIIYLEGDSNAINEPHSSGNAYNTKGDFLFAPFEFDNGPDGPVEGLSRFVKNGKIGFANRHGDIVIEAKFDYAQMFNYGTAAYCNGCTWKYKNEQFFASGGTWGYIDYQGNPVNVMDKKTNPKDQAVDSGRFLPYQFSYSAFEQNIIDSFYQLKEISKAYFVNYGSPLDSNERILRYEIVERPSSFFPYYFVATFLYDRSGEYRGNPFLGINFCVSKEGDRFYYYDAGNMVPLKTWLKEYIKNAKEYLKKHPDALYKF
ncbi:WG repeat-containing protein [Ferruginibacter sp.]